MKKAPVKFSTNYDAQAEVSSVEILNCRGSFYRVQLKPGTGPGLYSIKELRDDFETDGNPLLITSISPQQRDLVSETPCLDNYKVFTVFGQAFGQVTIEAEILLGDFSSNTYEVVQRLYAWFDKYRVSKRKLPISVSVGPVARYVYLTAMAVGKADAVYQTIPFLLAGTLLDLNGSDVSKINPNGLVITEFNIGEASLIEALKAPASLEDSTSALLLNSTPEIQSSKEADELTLSQAGKPTSADSVVAYKSAFGQPMTNDEQKLMYHNYQLQQLEAAGRAEEASAYRAEYGNEMQSLSEAVLLPYNSTATTAQVRNRYEPRYFAD